MFVYILNIIKLSSPLSKELRPFLMILPAQGATAAASKHHLMTYI